MVLASRDRQLGLVETDVARAHALDSQHLVARSSATNDFNVGLRNAERFREKLSKRFVCSSIHWSGSQCDFERAFVNAEHAIAARARRNAYLERDRTLLFSNLQLTHQSGKPT